MFGKKDKDKQNEAAKSPWDSVLNDDEDAVSVAPKTSGSGYDFVHGWKELVGKRLYHKEYCICVLVLSAEELGKKKSNGHCQHEYTIIHKGRCNVLTDDDIEALWDIMD